MKTNILLATAGSLFARHATAYFIMTGEPVVIDRIDPIISPGTVSGHVHNIVGASNIAADSTYESLRKAACTSLPITDDLSAYWQPQLYYWDPKNETYSLIPSYSKIYYLQRPGPKNEKIHAFPAGLQMLAGNPFRKTYNASNFADQAIDFVCQDYDTSHQGDPEWNDRPNFFNHNCPNGMRAQIVFPSCWDGVNLYKPDQSHMSYPVQAVNTGDCPASHPVHLVTLFQEFVYDVAKFPFNGNGSVTWVFANGDTTGYGLHADFMNGWSVGDDSPLQQALDTCGLDIGGNLAECAALAPYLDNDAAAACKKEGLIVNEAVGLEGPIKKLPGCNEQWSSGPKPSCPPEAEPGFVDPKSTPAKGYSAYGCLTEPNNGRLFTGASLVSDSMTAAVCTEFCAEGGFEWAGIEYGRECYCGSSFSNGGNATLVISSNCRITCPGNPNEVCGGYSKLTVYRNPANAVGDYPSLEAGWKSLGCIADNINNTRTLSDYVFTSDNMTISLCVDGCSSKGFAYAGIEYSRECYCAQKPHSLEPSTKCSMSCPGDVRYNCGGPAALNMFTNTVAVAQGYTYVGCVAEGTAGRLLTGSTISDDGMTPDVCTAFCAKSGLMYSGVEYGRECYCGSTFVNGGTGELIDESRCAMPCKGDSSVMCGGSSTLSLFKNPSFAPAAVTLPSGWKSSGCLVDNFNHTRSLDAYRFTASDMTHEKCIAGCAAKGYTIAGVEYSSECYCGDALTYNAPSTQCSMPCAGALSYICGGPDALTTFTATTEAGAARHRMKRMTTHRS